MWQAILFAAALALAAGSQGIPILDRSFERTDICNHCLCSRSTVKCDFGRDKALLNRWNGMYSISPGITGIEVQLTKGTQLILEEGLFRLNRVNRIVVTGGHGDDQVEVVQNALHGNVAGFPDIQILNVSNVFLREKAFSGGEMKLRVENSDLLVVYQSAFVNMNTTCNFTEIRSLVIKERAFNPSTDRNAKAYVNLHIGKSKIDYIGSFDMSMNKISFTKCIIGTIQSQAFDVTNINELSFEDCRITKIETMAFTSKLQSAHFSIVGTQIGTIDKEAIMGSGITKLTLRQNNIDTIKEDAIQVHSAFVYIQRNNIAHQGKNWLRIMNCELIAIEDNKFNNFGGIQLDQERRFNCTFMNNYLGNPQASSLNFSNCEVRAITVDRVCDCEDNRNWLPTVTEHDLSSELYCQLKETRLDRCFNASTVHLRRYNSEACGVNRTTLRCADSSTLEWYNGNFISKQEREEQQRGISLTKILVIAIVCVGIMLSIVFVIVCLCAKKFSGNQQKEHCELPQEALKILNQDIDEMHTQIMQHRNQLPQGSNEVIAKHLDQRHARATTPQPPLGYLSVEESAESAYSDHNGSPVENIYEEPLIPAVCMYTVPSDNRVSTVYTEPINAANTNDMPPAYDEKPDYATPHRQPPLSQRQQQLPSTSAGQRRHQLSNNYDTPVWHSAPNATPIGDTTSLPAHKQPPATQASSSRHVRDLRQDLEAMPQFHPNQLSSSRNQAQLQSRFVSNLPRRTTPCGNANIKRSFECLDGAASLAAMEHMDMRGAAAMPPDSGSDHSGGSDETVKIEDVIDYADA